MSIKNNAVCAAPGHILVLLRRVKLSLVLVMWCSVPVSIVNAGMGPQKRPAQVVTVSGATNNQYVIIETIIEKDVAKGADASAIITRSQRDTIRPGKVISDPLNIKLEIPTPPVRIETYGATQVMTKVGKLVGVVGGPKGAVAGAAIMGMAAVADYATHIAEQELTKLYGNQQFRINLIEIIPSLYYTINTQTNQVELKPGAENAFLAYKQQQERYLTALKDYQDMNSRYAQSYARVQALSGAGLSRQQFEQTMARSTELLNQTYERDVKPRLEAKNREERKFSDMYPPYRIAIMASPAAVGTTCKQFGKGQGPWELSVIYYIGAQQTNQIAVKYCVPDGKQFQDLAVTLMHNNIRQIDIKKRIQEFIPGGIVIAGTRNASFAQATGPHGADYRASQTGVLNWFTEMVTHPEAGGVAQFMVPFDLYELRQGVAQRVKETNDAKMEKILDSMDQVIAQSAAAAQKWEEYKKQQQAQKEQPAQEAKPAAAPGAGAPAQQEPSQVMPAERQGASPAAESAPPVAGAGASSGSAGTGAAPTVLLGSPEQEEKIVPETSAQTQEEQKTGVVSPGTKKRPILPTLTPEQKEQALIGAEFATGAMGIYGLKPTPKQQALIEQATKAHGKWQEIKKK